MNDSAPAYRNAHGVVHERPEQVLVLDVARASRAESWMEAGTSKRSFRAFHTYRRSRCLPSLPASFVDADLGAAALQGRRLMQSPTMATRVPLLSQRRISRFLAIRAARRR